jgi:hypothetical protein
MVIVFAAHVAVTPAGNPAATPMPVAPVVAIVITGLMAMLTHSVGFEEGAPAVLLGDTVMVPVAFTVPQPPVSGIL